MMSGLGEHLKDLYLNFKRGTYSKDFVRVTSWLTHFYHIALAAIGGGDPRIENFIIISIEEGDSN